MTELRTHGGPDAQGVPRWDFSTNANACGPAPMALRAVQDADPTRYPDPTYAALRAALAGLHGVAPERIVLAASASEFILRLTAAVAQRDPQAPVWAPQPGYGDYAHAAQAHRLPRAERPEAAALLWHTAPSSPLGQDGPMPAARGDAVRVVDAAYGPLRLGAALREGRADTAIASVQSLDAVVETVPTEFTLPQDAWQLISPNKALGLTGVRAGYAIAPASGDLTDAWCEALQRLAPSWPIGAHGVAMLQAWAQPATQDWVRESLHTLRVWKARQLALQQALGWVCEPSVTPFYLTRWPQVDGDLHPQESPQKEVCPKDVHPGAARFAQVLQGLRAEGIKLRDASSFGLPGCVRVSVQRPEAQDALAAAWRRKLQP